MYKEKQVTLYKIEENIIHWYKTTYILCTIRDMFHVYLNRFEFHFLRLHIIKQTNFAFLCITDVSLVVPNRLDGNL